MFTCTALMYSDLHVLKHSNTRHLTLSSGIVKWLKCKLSYPRSLDDEAYIVAKSEHMLYKEC